MMASSLRHCLLVLLACTLTGSRTVSVLVLAADVVQAAATVAGPVLDPGASVAAAAAASGGILLPTTGSIDPAVLSTIVPPQDLLTSSITAVLSPPSTNAARVGRPLVFTKTAAAQMAAVTQAEQAVAAAGAAAPAAMSPQYATILSKHNTYRSKHGAAALVWDDYQASRAAAYAAKCVWGHDRNANAGENLYATSAKNDPTAALTAAIEAWYIEVNKYSFGNPGFSGATGHFTQVVWRGSSLLGCAVQVCSSLANAWASGGTLVVCRYSPAGNVIGQFPQNVLPAGSDPGPGNGDGSSGGGGGGGSNPGSGGGGDSGGGGSGGGGGGGGGGDGSGGGGGSGGGTTPVVPIPPATIPAGYMIQGPGCLNSANNRFKFCVLDDASIVLFGQDNTALWSSNTRWASAAKPFRLIMQRDGNLVAFDSKAVPVWSSNTAGRGTGPGYRLVVMDNGNVVVFDALNMALWATNTCCH